MKLLFDANVSPRLARALQDVFLNATHVFDCGGIHDDDILIWEFAKANGFVIVTKDGDFQALSTLHGAPPKVVWLRVGNARTDAIEQLLRSRAEDAVVRIRSTHITARLGPIVGRLPHWMSGMKEGAANPVAAASPASTSAASTIRPRRR